MKIRPTKQQREAAFLAAGRIEQPTSIVSLAADGTKIDISDEERDQLLAKCAAAEHVKLVIEVLAYEHKAGEPNRRYVRLRDSAVQPAAKTAVGRPFLRDHEQINSLARGGTVLESRGVRRGEGDYAIVQKVELTAPWAVELALRGLLTFVSIGLRPTGPVLCSHCRTEVFEACFHFPGETIGTDKAGSEIVCEWIYTSAELVETSAVNVPAVPGAHIEGIRAALSAALGGSPPERETKMDPELLKLLGLAATASEAEIRAAVEAQRKLLQAREVELGIANNDLASAAAERDALRQAKLAADAKAFIDEAVSLGQIAPADTETWSTLYALDSDKAVKLMAARKPGTATPVGAQRQTATTVQAVTENENLQADPVITGGESPRGMTFGKRVAHQLSAAIAQLSSNPRAAAFAAHVFGFDGKGKVKIPTTLGATSISNNADLEAAQIGYRAAMLESVVGEMDPLLMIATEVASNRAEESYKWLGDLPSMDEWKNDRIMKQLEAYSWAIKNKKWQATLRVKNDDFRDDALGLLPAHVAGMGEQARLQPALLVARLLVNGFDGTAFPELGDGLAFDGAFFFDTTHVTGSNKMTVAFSGPNLQTALTNLRSQKRFDGTNLYAKGTHLFVGIDNEYAAEKIMTAELLANAAGTAADSNVLRGKLKIVVSPEILNGEWFVADLSNPVKPMLFQNREGITTTVVGGRAGVAEGGSDMVGFMYDETWFGAQSRNNAGYFDFRRIIGSKP